MFTETLTVILGFLFIYVHQVTINQKPSLQHSWMQSTYGENVKVAWHMLNHPQRGPGRGSMVTGCYQHIVGYSSHKSKLDTRPEQQKCLFTKLTHFLFFLEIVIVASHFSLLCYNNLSLSCNSLML